MGGRPGGPGGMQPGPLGGMGGVPNREEREHRNNVFILDDEPFRVVFDDVITPVIGPGDVR
ncbi:hypothetical protein [Pseudonocardia acaciae]|uniref:hypothetical protein n=1 Tax=Pseudonocardia acaciae TaxID=551276 RepID=UPI0012EE7DC8|nr:hypothetical protein [Pseudonocardia acaciae]